MVTQISHNAGFGPIPYNGRTFLSMPYFEKKIKRYVATMIDLCLKDDKRDNATFTKRTCNLLLTMESGQQSHGLAKISPSRIFTLVSSKYLVLDPWSWSLDQISFGKAYSSFSLVCPVKSLFCFGGNRTSVRVLIPICLALGGSHDSINNATFLNWTCNLFRTMDSGQQFHGLSKIFQLTKN